MQLVDALYHLQRYDDTLAELAARLQALADEDGALVVEETRMRNREEALKRKIRAREAEAARFEAAAEARSAEIARMNARYLQVKTEKELEKFNQELRQLEADREAQESAALAAMEQIEALKGELAAAEADRRRRAADFQIQRDRINRETANLSEEQRKIAPLRETFRAGIDAKALECYDRIAAKRKPAVARVERQTCQGCRLQLAATVLSELRDRDHPRSCSSCGRLLYLPPR